MDKGKQSEDRERYAELKQRIEDKINELMKYLEEFSEFEIPEFEDFKTDIKMKAICERYFEKIVEVIIELAFLTIRAKKLTSPESEEHAFFILSRNNIITEEFAKRLKDAKDMRNRIVHNYADIDDFIVYHSVTEEILKDAEDFLKAIEASLK